MLSKRQAYAKWLGINEHSLPPNHYRLLGIDRFETDPDIISNAADARMVYLRQYQSGENAAVVADILSEVANARIALLTAEKKLAYDAKLRETAAPKPVAFSSHPTVVSVLPPVVAPRAASDSSPWSSLDDPAPASPVVAPAAARKVRPVWADPTVVGLVALAAIGSIVAVALLRSDVEKPAAATSKPPIREEPVEPRRVTASAPTKPLTPKANDGTSSATTQPKSEDPGQPKSEDPGQPKSEDPGEVHPEPKPPERGGSSQTARADVFAEVVDRISLPALPPLTPGNGAVGEAVSLGRTKLEGSPFQIKLLSAESERGFRFDLADDPAAAGKAWVIFQESKNDGERVAVARVAIDDQGSSMQWLAGATTIAVRAQQLSNAGLLLTSREADHFVALCEPVLASPLLVDLDLQRPTPYAVPIKFIPDPMSLRLEITKVESDLTGATIEPRKILSPALRNKTGKTDASAAETQIRFAVKTDGKTVFVILRVGFAATGNLAHIRVEPYYALGEHVPPEPLRVAAIQTALQQVNNSRQAVDAAIKANMKGLDKGKAAEQVAKFQELGDMLSGVNTAALALSKNTTIHYRVYVDIAGRHLELASTEAAPARMLVPSLGSPTLADHSSATHPEGSESPRPDRLSPPEPAAQQAVLAKLREAYREDYQKGDKAVFAQKLLKIASETNEAVDRYVLLQQAMDLAVKANQGQQAFEIIDLIAADYQIKAAEMKAAVLEVGVKQTRTPFDREGIVDVAFAVIDQAVAEEDFATARRTLQMVTNLANRIKEPDLILHVGSLRKNIEAVEKVTADARLAIETLKANEDDPDANLALGKYLCLAKGNWEEGLPMLARGSDMTLKALAERDLRGVKTADEDYDLGNSWWESGAFGQKRAVICYERTIPSLSDLKKAAAEARVAEYAASHKSEARLSGRRITRVVLYNTHNSYWRNCGTRLCNVVLFRGANIVWQQKNVTVEWDSRGTPATTIPVPSVGADRLRIEVIAWHQAASGFSEVEVYAGSRNLVEGAEATWSAPHRPENDPSPKTMALTDSILESDEKPHSGYSLGPMGKSCWVDIPIPAHPVQ
jgi:hypothetical protein